MPILNGISLTTPLYIQIGFVPNLHIEELAAAARQPTNHPRISLGDLRVISRRGRSRFNPIRPPEQALQPHHGDKVAVIASVDEIDPTSLGPRCAFGDAIE